MKIFKLDSSVYNKISAGEVVERPASVVKELVENAIDAGATKIEVRVRNGGLDEILVSDNGCGMAPDDLETAFLPHATSKIRTADDLTDITTLGFRGEALPSIAAVSMIEIASKSSDNENGHFLKLRGGTVEEKGIVARNAGTEILVKNLFFNTPARLKFLKTPSGEMSDVKSTVIKLILANPYVSLSLYDEKGKIYSSDGKGLKSAIDSVFSEDITENLLPLNYEKSGVSVKGFASRSTFFKMNRTYQISIINGRVAENQQISAAITTVYQQYLMKRNYPVTVLDISLPTDKIDVNVHPTKAEVRFSEGDKVFSAVYHAIKDAVEQDITARHILFETVNDDAEQVLPMGEMIRKEESFPFNTPIPEEIPFRSPFKMISDDSEAEFSEESDIQRAIKENYRKIKLAKQETVQTTIPETEDIYRVIGQVFGTYLLVEYDEKFIIVDQHAAVERLRYDKLLEAYNNGPMPVQPLLFPRTIDVSPSEYPLVEKKLPMLKQIGVELIPFGDNAFKLITLPEILSEVDADKLMKLILSDTPEGEDSLIRERLAYAACRSSIKGNTYLTDDQICELMTVYFKQGLPVQCPHGRPTYYVYTKRDLEKLFKRIV